MSLPEELLMAYADGELNGAGHAAERARVEAAMKADPEVARTVERHKALRQRLSATFDRVLDEPVPERLVAAIRSAPAAHPAAHGVATSGMAPSGIAPSRVADLDRARAERAAASAALTTSSRPPRNWGSWVAVAASIVICTVIGYRALYAPPLNLIGQRDGHLVAQAGLADALSNQLASTQALAAPVQIGTSFKSKSGEYCRTFVLHQRPYSVAGLACRAGDNWNLNPLAEVESRPAGEGYRTAGTELPAQLRTAVEHQIVGDPLDSSAEARARSNGWK